MANLLRNPTIMPSRVGNRTSLRHSALLALAAPVSMLAAGAILASEASHAGGAGMPNDLVQAVDEYRQATMRGDIATLSNLVGDDYILVNSDSTLQGKHSYLEDFRLPGFKIDEYVVKQPAYKAWGDTALVRSLLHLAWTQDGKQHRRMLRIAHVWIRHDGHWQLAYTQLTRVPEQ